MNWLKQATGKPLFPDVLWSRPENKRHAGKLLVFGGHAQQFAAPSEAYAAAIKAGVGAAKIVLPDALQKTVGKLFPEAEFAPSTPIGSFSRQALDGLLDAADWADGLLLAGDFGRNSETAVLLEGFVAKAAGPLTIAGDSVDYFNNSPARLFERPKTVIAADVAKLQKLAQDTAVIKQTADLVVLVRQLSEWAKTIKPAIITVHQNQIIVVLGEQISTTPITDEPVLTNLAAYASVWFLQQPEQAFAALTSAACEFSGPV